METITHTIPPIFDEHSEVLVLGTMPSPRSREVGFYYGHPQNRFWRVLAALFDEPVATTNDRRRDQLLRHHIALWDVLASCDIEGASDASIANAAPNDIARIVGASPIRAVFCTGSKAAQLYRRFFGGTFDVPCVQLPSTSPANAAWNLERLAQAYRVILPYLHTPAPTTLPVEEVVALERAIDASGTSLTELMDRAGLWLAHRVHARLAASGSTARTAGRILILCGNGNNGGDGWVAARHLARWGHEVALLCARAPEKLRAEPARTAALAAREELSACAHARVHVVDVTRGNSSPCDVAALFGQADVVVDALLGTGFAGDAVKEPFASWIRLANDGATRHSAAIVSADVPSGLHADTGDAAADVICADETVTMIVGKPGLYTTAGAPLCGTVTVAPLAYLAPFLDQRAHLPSKLAGTPAQPGACPGGERRHPDATRWRTYPAKPIRGWRRPSARRKDDLGRIRLLATSRPCKKQGRPSKGPPSQNPKQ